LYHLILKIYYLPENNPIKIKCFMKKQTGTK
jgi:hypothetical protein